MIQDYEQVGITWWMESADPWQWGFSWEAPLPPEAANAAPPAPIQAKPILAPPGRAQPTLSGCRAVSDGGIKVTGEVVSVAP